MTTNTAKEIGTAWGQQEVELWLDQHPAGAPMPAWIMGAYCGKIESEQQEAEIEIDNAAREVWEAARG